MEKESICKMIQIPIMNAPGEYIKFFPDELPADPYDVIDVLRSELAPLKIWRACAIEYMKQGSEDGFNVILQDIVENLRDPTLEDCYKQRDDYAEGITDIFLAFAAKELLAFSKAKLSSSSTELIQAAGKRCIDFIKLADDKLRLYEYTWFIKGFYEMVSGDYKRAEEHFRLIHDRAMKGNISKKKFTFVSYIGLGMVAYANSKFSVALEHFSKAVEYYPQCHASVRAAIACCCYKLQDYERAKLAVQRGIQLDSSDVNYLILLSMLELIQARKDKNSRIISRQSSYEYLYLAHQIDGTNPLVLNLLANHSFHSWKRINLSEMDFEMMIVEDTKLTISKQAVEYLQQLSGILEIGNQLRFNGMFPSKSTVHLIVSIKESVVSGNDLLEITYTPSLSGSLNSRLKFPLSVSEFEIKNLKQVVDDASKSLLHTSLPLIRTESYYLLGKVAHTQGNSSQAYDFYRLALKESPENVLAAFGAAQILFTRRDYKNALDLFEKVLKKYPDDKDTLAYIILLKGQLNEEVANFDKLKEIIPGFQFEIDVWLMQGQLYHKKVSNGNDYGVALKCYLQAKEWFEQQDRPVPAHVLNNIAILYQLMMKYDKAIEFMQRALRSFSVTAGTSDGVTIGNNYQRNLREDSLNSMLLNHADYEKAYFQWNTGKVSCHVSQHPDSCNHFILISTHNADVPNSPSMMELFVVGEQIMINDMIWVVDDIISPTEMFCSTIFRSKSYRIGMTDECRQSGFAVQQKLIYGNINDDTFSYSYNYARILEDSGNLFAAKHIYINLIYQHPSFVDSYMRLSIISRQLHHYEEALQWLHKAKNVFKGDSVGIELALGDVFMALGKTNEAKRQYETIYAKNRKDHQVLLAMGNYYYYQYIHKKDESSLKMAYKFYYPTLAENTKNIYATNGLGVVCAEKKEFEAAREIFSKIRQANLSNTEDIDVNFATIQIFEKRYGEAERVFLSNYKNLVKISATQTIQPTTSENFLHLLQSIAFSQFHCQRYDEALKNILRAWHFLSNSEGLHSSLCYNIVSIIEKLTSNSQKINKNSEELEGSMVLCKLVIKMITTMLQHHSTKERSFYLTKPSTIEGKLLKDKYGMYKDNFKSMHTQLHKMKQEEEKILEERKRYEEEHLLKKRLAEEEKQKQLMEQEQKRQLSVLQAQEKEKRLQELQDKWVSSTVGENMEAANRRKRSNADNENGAKKKARKRSKNKKLDDEDDEDEDGDDNVEDDEGNLQRRKKSKGKTVDDDIDDDDAGMDNWLDVIGGDTFSQQRSQLDMLSDDDELLADSGHAEETDQQLPKTEGRLKKNKLPSNIEEEVDEETKELFG